MSRPVAGSECPFSRAEVALIAGVNADLVERLLSKKVIVKTSHGRGKYHGYSDDDALRITVSKQLLRCGLRVDSVHSLFQSIEKDWPRLRTPAARVLGSVLVLVLGHPSGPDPTQAAHAYLATAAEAVEWLKSRRTIIAIDLGALIADMETRTGRPFGA